MPVIGLTGLLFCVLRTAHTAWFTPDGKARDWLVEFAEVLGRILLLVHISDLVEKCY